MHAVIRRGPETTKLRIMYNGSVEPTGRNDSLNDCLETGPNYTLVIFCWHEIGLAGITRKGQGYGKIPMA